MTGFSGRTALVTGGAGFVGANLALALKSRHPDLRVVAVDNLRRRGSELNLPRLRAGGVEFQHADIRQPGDLDELNIAPDVILECSAEPSVLAGYNGAPDYLVDTNLVGTVNCLNLARRAKSDFIFLSTSRVYPVDALNSICPVEVETRFAIAPDQSLDGVSPRGVSESFPLQGPRSLYGTTKLCSELLIEEYAAMYGLRFVINRCGVITGPWQMGKVDQGIFALWVAHHYFGKPLSYIGWGGGGKQVRDLLHIDDLSDLIDIEWSAMSAVNGRIFNAGGGAEGSLSLLETTNLCREITGRQIPIRSVPDNRPADVRIYVSDNSSITRATNWSPRRSPRDALQAIFEWIRANEAAVAPLWK